MLVYIISPQNTEAPDVPTPFHTLETTADTSSQKEGKN